MKKLQTKIDIYRKILPSCLYCVHNKTYGTIGRVAECVALQKLCFSPAKVAKKCPLYTPREFQECECSQW